MAHCHGHLVLVRRETREEAPVSDQLIACGLVAGHGRDVWALDVTADVPGVYMMVAVSRDRTTGNVVKGLGAHPSPHRALRRALMECCQMLANVLPACTDGEQALRPVAAQPSPPAGSEQRDQVHLVPSLDTPTRTCRDYPSAPPAATVRTLVQALEEKRIDVLVQDVTRTDLGLPVVRVVTPGMRSWFTPLAPGRLYTVPVELGDRKTAIDEAHVNRADFEDWGTTLEGEVVETFLNVRHR